MSENRKNAFFGPSGTLQKSDLKLRIENLQRKSWQYKSNKQKPGTIKLERPEIPEQDLQQLADIVTLTVSGNKLDKLDIVNLWTIFANYELSYKNAEAKNSQYKQTKILDDLFKKFVNALIKETTKQIDYLNPGKNNKQFSNLIKACNSINPWNLVDISNINFRKKMTECFGDFIDPHQPTFTLYDILKFLMNSGVKWENLPNNSKKSLITLMKNDTPNDQTLVNLIWLLAVIETPKKDNSLLAILDQKLIQIIEQQCKIMDKHTEIIIGHWGEREEALTYLQKIRQICLFYDITLPEEIVNKLTSHIAEQNITFETKPHGTYEESLLKTIDQITGLKVLRNQDPLKFKPVDGYIEIENKKFVIEADGSFHYSEHGELRPTDRFNQKILENHDFSVIRFKQSDWAPKSHEDKITMLREKLTDAGVIPRNNLKFQTS